MIASVPLLDQPVDVSVVEGEILVIGPSGLVAAFTPAAAAESARRLLSAAETLLRGPCEGLRAFD
jgi:hypothetical protein